MRCTPRPGARFDGAVESSHEQYSSGLAPDNGAEEAPHDHASYTLTEGRNASKSSPPQLYQPGTKPSKCLVGGSDRFEVSDRVGTQASKIQLSIVFDPPHGDLHGFPIAFLGLGISGFVTVTPDACLQLGENIFCLFMQQALDQGEVMRM